MNCKISAKREPDCGRPRKRAWKQRFLHSLSKEQPSLSLSWLYHIGVPEDQIEGIVKNQTNIVPCIMPFITAFFMPRTGTGRPLVRPEDAKNFAFIGEFAQTAGDTVFTTEYAMRTGIEAVYGLFDV